MIGTLAKKEFLTNLVSPRFAIGFVLCLVLIPFSLLINIGAYRERAAQYRVDRDAAEKDSPHWFNPNENVSTTRRPVAFEKVPQFEERPMPFAARIGPALKYLLINVFVLSAVYLLAFVLFVRYDVR